MNLDRAASPAQCSIRGTAHPTGRRSVREGRPCMQSMPIPASRATRALLTAAARPVAPSPIPWYRYITDS